MKIFRCGGCVRDILLGLEPKDIDYVVIGATPEEMIAQGFTQVGADFPVFLHPETKEEYALARKERKVGVGYHGFETVFDTSVTLEEDLYRRDLTINSMAQDIETGEIIDPYNGRKDLADKRLRHTSEAFSEDPLRALRVARFAARYGFFIAEETIKLMDKIAQSGELQSISKERVWIEFEKALSEKKPIMFFHYMHGDCHSLMEQVFPELVYANFEEDVFKLVTNAHQRMAYLLMVIKDDDNDIFEISRRMRIPTEIAQLASNAIKLEKFIEQPITAEKTVEIFDAFRVHNNISLFAEVITFLTNVKPSTSDFWGIIMKMMIGYREVTFIPPHLKGREIGEYLKSERVNRIREILQE